MSACSLRIIADQPFGNTAGLAGRLTFDVDEEDSVDKLGRLLRRKQSDTSANLRSSLNGRGKANLIQAVIDGHRDARTDTDRLFEKVTQQRKGQKTMGNAAVEGRFVLRSLRVQVNSLAVLGRVGKFLDAILRDDEPICRWEFASFTLFQGI